MKVQDFLDTKFTAKIIVACIIMQFTIAQRGPCINGKCTLKTDECYKNQCYEVVGDCNESKQCEHDDSECVDIVKKTNICIWLKTPEVHDTAISMDDVTLPLYGNIDYVTEVIDDVTTQSDDITASTDDDTVSIDFAMLGDDVTVPADDITVPADDDTEPSDDVTVPADDVTVPSDDVTVPADDVTVPADDVTVPADDVTVPADDDTEPSDDVTVPADDVTVPADDVTVPADDVTVPADDVTTMPTKPPIPTSDGCYDRIPDCSKYYYLCTNELYKSLMFSLCQFTCGYCETSVTTKITPEICQDMAAPNRPSDCPLYSHLCNNSIYKELMKQECPKTCGFCGSTILTTSTTPICEDKKGIDGQSNCNDVRYLCYVPLYMPLISVQCPYTCGLC